MWGDREAHKIVGACLAAARKEAKVSQDELAARLKKPQSLISDYEIGDRRVDLVEFFIVARALEIDPKKLFASVQKALADQPLVK